MDIKMKKNLSHYLLACTLLVATQGALSEIFNSSSTSKSGSSVIIDHVDRSYEFDYIRSHIASARSSSADSWWHALDGVPFLLSRHPKRRLTKNASSYNNSGMEISNHIQNHRFLAFEDYADPTFNCPATTTCPVVCVAAIEECPEDATCANANPDFADHEFEVCADGTCADFTLGESCDVELESSCACELLPVTCPKQIDLYDQCFERFQRFYDDNTKCIEEQVESLPQVDFNGVAFKACYIPFIAITLLMFLWCAYNQRFAPVKGSSTKLNSVVKGKENEQWTQTGYQRTIVGMVLYGLVIFIHLFIQVVLLFLAIEYYVQQEASPVLENVRLIFYDDKQALMAFEIVWMTGFVWCLILKYPPSIFSLFLRRCLPCNASYVAVSAPVRKIDAMNEENNVGNFSSSLERRCRCFMNFCFSMQLDGVDTGLDYKTDYCEVKIGESKLTKLDVADDDIQTQFFIINHLDEITGCRYFYFRMRRYIFDDALKKFVSGHLDISTNTKIGHWFRKDFLRLGLSTEESSKRLGVLGPNVLDLKKPTILGSIMQEFREPFYLYQNFMVWTWVNYWYYYMAIIQTIVRVTGALVVAFFQYISDLKLYKLMVVEGTADVIRDGKLVRLNQIEVVPGDVVRLSPGLVYFDMALIRSEHLLVDESALTGEVQPVAKTALDPANSHLFYNPHENKSSTISAGTTILECGEGDERDGDLAIVTQTGSFTAKGELLSDVLSYERHQFKFDTEVKWVLFILLIEMAIYVSFVFATIEDDWVYAWFYAVFVAGTVIPPLLPTVFVVSVGISCKRLEMRRISCSNSTGILVAGKVNKAFFDKTGTLTEQGLQFISAQVPKDFGRSESDPLEMNKISPILQLAISVCHTLTLSTKGDIIGPAVDRMAFSAVASSFLLDEKTVIFGNETIKYLKRFEFDHHSMTQSVIIQRGAEKLVFVKGSPEAISKLCIFSSLPTNFAERARHAARNGVYQLAVASSKYLGQKGMNEVNREDIERDLIFTGCINFQNIMKKDSPAVISELRNGNIESVIITGDNVLTGIHIAKKSGIIPLNKQVIFGSGIDGGNVKWCNFSDDKPANDPMVSLECDTVLAMTGEVWNHLLLHNPKGAIILGKQTSVFGRCTPNDKVSVVSTFVQCGDITLMCGDGGNDCGALKAAHVGIALSDAEASVVSPFTSLDKEITSVVEVLREGRCALASALASYKYMIMYGQVESMNQLINAYLSVTFSEWCWVFMDGFWPITMAFSLPLSKAAKTLSPKHPTASILGSHTISSAVGVLTINFIFSATTLAILWNQDWFKCRMWSSSDVSNVNTIGDNYEATVIFIVTGYQYISSAAAFNFGYMHRANWFRNYVFVFFFLLWTIFQFTATLTATKFSCIWRVNCDNDNVVRSVTNVEPQPLSNPFNTTVMPMSFRCILAILMIGNLVGNCAWEYLVLNKMFCKRQSTSETKYVELHPYLLLPGIN